MEQTLSGGRIASNWPKIAEGEIVVFGRLLLIDLTRTSKSVDRISLSRVTAAVHKPGQSQEDIQHIFIIVFQPYRLIDQRFAVQQTIFFINYLTSYMSVWFFDQLDFNRACTIYAKGHNRLVNSAQTTL